jgi:hypothetical protein
MTTQEERKLVARTLRTIRGRIRELGVNPLRDGLLREWKRHATLLRVFRKIDAKHGVVR